MYPKIEDIMFGMKFNKQIVTLEVVRGYIVVNYGLGL